jgi:hypothetical protein
MTLYKVDSYMTTVPKGYRAEEQQGTFCLIQEFGVM